MKNRIWFSDISLKKINEVLKNSLAEHLSISCIEILPDALLGKMEVSKKHLQPFGIMHGGASCVLAETLGSVAANLCVDPKEKTCVGLEINVNHIRPMKEGTLIAKAKPFHIGRTTQVWEIQIENELKKLVAISRLTVSVVNLEKMKSG